MLPTCPFCLSAQIQSRDIGRAAGAYAAQAQRSAPPVPPSPTPFAIAYGVGCLLVYRWVNDYFPAASGQWAVAGLAELGVVWTLMMSWRAAMQDYKADEACWRSNWFCHACGQRHERP